MGSNPTPDMHLFLNFIIFFLPLPPPSPPIFLPPFLTLFARRPARMLRGALACAAGWPMLEFAGARQDAPGRGPPLASPRLELGSLESRSRVLTVTPWGRGEPAGPRGAVYTGPSSSAGALPRPTPCGASPKSLEATTERHSALPSIYHQSFAFY